LTSPLSSSVQFATDTATCLGRSLKIGQLKGHYFRRLVQAGFLDDRRDRDLGASRTRPLRRRCSSRKAAALRTQITSTEISRRVAQPAPARQRVDRDNQRHAAEENLGAVATVAAADWRCAHLHRLPVPPSTSTRTRGMLPTGSPRRRRYSQTSGNSRSIRRRHGHHLQAAIRTQAVASGGGLQARRLPARGRRRRPVSAAVTGSSSK
jgi:hypothetical protein